MTLQFRRATKARSHLRLALMGPPGAGKTYTALRLANGLVGDAEGAIALIDSERGSGSLYAGVVCEFDVLELHTYEVERYIEAIETAGRAGFRCLIIDSLSHAWAGVGGLLERVDAITRRSKSGNSFTAWRDATPLHNRLVDTILAYPGHVIVTLRSKVEYVLEEDSKGKKTPTKKGMAPIQRDGLEYEFTVVMDMDTDNYAAVTKTRCPALQGKVIHQPGEALAQTLLAWLEDGEERAPVPAPAPIAAPAAAPTPTTNHPPQKRTRTPQEAYDAVAKAHPKSAHKALAILKSGMSDVEQLKRLRQLYRELNGGYDVPEDRKADEELLKDRMRAAVRAGIPMEELRTICERHGALAGVEYRWPGEGLPDGAYPAVEAEVNRLLAREADARSRGDRS